jgi:hypothetical protein
MKSLIVKLVAVLGLTVNSLTAATNILPGLIVTNTTLSGTNLVQSTVVVTNGATLTIQPGTQMLMNTGATLVVYGQLLANGTSNQPIYFTRATTAARWARIRFVHALDSVLRNCVVEYSNCAGDHKDYYDNDCNTNTIPPARNYHEAVVVLATHLDIEGCTFQNLPDSSATAEGDAIAIIADDPQVPGLASAHIWNCRFPNIGQGIHTRFSYVLVEGCVFSGKRGDNDDVDLYGESVPPPVIRRNLFLPGHEDKINPTRCSAIIYGNIVSGADDHGIVLRDKCMPIVFNNLIYNCTNAGIAVQNQCNALIANNTIVNSLRAIRFFDHFDRHGPPYCLFPGSGRATILNCVIWDCATSFELADSTNGQSYASVAYCDVEGGQATASVSAGSTLVWGPGNINIDPQFVGLATNNYRLRANSPCIDAGTNVSAVATNFVFALTNDFEDVPRPLDGNGDGVPRFDMGAHEFLLATADSNADGIPDGWTWNYRLNPTDPSVAGSNPDADAFTTWQEWIADTNPTNAQSVFNVLGISIQPQVAVSFLSSSNRTYTLYSAGNLVSDQAAWTPVAGQTNVRGTGGVATLADTAAPPRKFYRVGVQLP